MDLNSYSRRTAALNRRTTARILALLARVSVPITPENIRLLAAALFPTVSRSRQAAQELAAQFFQTAAEAPQKVVKPLRTYTEDDLYRGLADALRASSGQPVSYPVNRRKIVGMVTKHVEDGGRREVMALALDKNTKAVGWARYDPRPPSCAFCLTMISRGPVYNTAESAGESDQWHPHCTCKVVPVFDRESWPGRNQYLSAQRVYAAATKKHGVSINAVRRYLDEQDNDSARSAA